MTLRRTHRRGIAYVVTLWVLVALTAIALSIGTGVRTERVMASNATSATRARLIERGALAYVLSAAGRASDGMPDVSADTIRVGDGAFWILAGDPDNTGKMTFGLVDEGGKIDLNTAPLEILEKLPGATEEIAASIVDWRDEDETVTGAGAESDYYLRRSPAHQAHNGPFETVDELRMVAGVDAEALYGGDANRDRLLDDDANSDDGLGLLGTTTAWLKWPSRSNQNALAINTARREQIQQALAEPLGEQRVEALMADLMRRRPYPSLFHLYYRPEAD